jgi:hypothetical protein
LVPSGKAAREVKEQRGQDKLAFGGVLRRGHIDTVHQPSGDDILATDETRMKYGWGRAGNRLGSMSTPDFFHLSGGASCPDGSVFHPCFICGLKARL